MEKMSNKLYNYNLNITNFISSKYFTIFNKQIKGQNFNKYFNQFLVQGRPFQCPHCPAAFVRKPCKEHVFLTLRSRVNIIFSFKKSF